MRALVWIILFLIGLAGVVLPGIYLHTASGLPRLESANDLETHFRLSVEGERRSIQAGTFAKNKRPVDFDVPRFTDFPKSLVALYISQMGCPGFFQSPREAGPKWAWRMFAGVSIGARPEGDGGCERILAMRLARSLGIEGELERTVAANKLHAFLDKAELVSWDLATTYFERGVVGVNDAAFRIYKKELKDMQLAELAEFALALPVNGFYGELKTCRKGPLIKQNRDAILEILAEHALVTPEEARKAMSAPIACLQ